MVVMAQATMEGEGGAAVVVTEVGQMVVAVEEATEAAVAGPRVVAGEVATVAAMAAAEVAVLALVSKVQVEAAVRALG